MRFTAIEVCSVYWVPCAQGDDHVMAALVMRQGARLDPDELYRFVVAQGDLSPKWMPDYLRVADALPQTRTNKILRGTLKQEAFDLERVKDPLYWRERGEQGWKPFSPEHHARVREQFERAGRPDAMALRG